MDDAINPEIRPYLIELIDELIDRPLSMALGANLKENPFLPIKQKLISNHLTTLTSFRKSVEEILSRAKSDESEAVVGASQVLHKLFMKRFEYIFYLNSYNFRNIIMEAAKNSFPNVDFWEYEEEEDIPETTRNASKKASAQSSKSYSAKNQSITNESDGNGEEDDL